MACDTETVRDEPWSVQLANMVDPEGAMFYCDNLLSMSVVRIMLESDTTLTVLHNAKFDLDILSQCGIHPAHTECTMQMAYLLGYPALSLKVLAYRLAGIDMRTYKEVTAEATAVQAEAYLEEVSLHEWPDPDPTMAFDKDGMPKFSFPKNIQGKVKRLLDKHLLDPSINLYDKWHLMDEAGGRGQVEAVLGRMHPAYLDEVNVDVAEAYARLDAKATLAIYGTLHARIMEFGLQGVLERDMDTLPMIMQMEGNGVLLDTSVLEELRADLDVLTADTQADIDFIAGHYVNPRSSQQVVALLQDKGIYTDMETSTDASVLDQFREHTIVGKIQNYRAYTKLQSTYVAGLMKAVDGEGKIHTKFSTTRTETGRLASSDPNLQNIPVRTELGRRIRQAFVAERGE